MKNRIDYLMGFLQWLEFEHDVDLVFEELSDYGDGCSNLHKVGHEKQLELAKDYINHATDYSNGGQEYKNEIEALKKELG